MVCAGTGNALTPSSRQSGADEFQIVDERLVLQVGDPIIVDAGEEPVGSGRACENVLILILENCQGWLQEVFTVRSFMGPKKKSSASRITRHEA